VTFSGPATGGHEGGRIPALDGLRAIACLAVFGVHWQQFTGASGSWGPVDLQRLLENGNTGVSLFFTLSAFLLSLRFWQGRWGTPGKPWVREYIASRSARILPAYYASLAAAFVLGGSFLTGAGRVDAGWHVLLVHNLREASFYTFNPSFWTIAVQAQSYVALPVVLYLTVRTSGSAKVRASLLIGLALVSYALQYWLLSGAGDSPLSRWLAERPTVSTHSLLAHAPHFLMGAVAGLAFARHNRPHDAGRPVRGRWAIEASVWMAALAILAVLATRLDDRFSVPFGRYNLPWVPLLVTWIIIAAPRTTIARSVLDVAPLRWLGTISYGVYVYHYLALEAVARALREGDLTPPDRRVLFGAASLALTAIVSFASYRWFETPLARVVTRRRTLSSTPPRGD